jgi:hypothetical protein
VLATAALAAELRAPGQVTAGTAFAIASDGSGRATFYLIGPAQVSERKVNLGENIAVQPQEVQRAGRYTALACVSGDCTAVDFYVRAAEPERLSFLVHPSRVPVNNPNAISAVAFLFDRFHNLVRERESVTFRVIPQSGAALSETRGSQDGVAWIRLTSSHKEGPTKIAASLGDAAEEIRMVQQIASDACNLRIHGEWISQRFFVQTDPVRDCNGNDIPNGTVVSFTKTDAGGKTTVDVPIKKGVARVEMPVLGQARINVASGVATGNELSVAARP